MALQRRNTPTEEVQEPAAEKAAAATEAATETLTETQVLEDAEEVETTPVKAPAVRGSGAVAPAQGTATALAALAELGFDGVETDWTSYPTVVLDKTEFATSDGNSLDTDEITVRLLGSRKRFMFKQKVANDDSDEPELAYTHDLSELDDPDSELSKKLKAWKDEEGLDYVVKEYVEAFAVVQDEKSRLDGQMVMLQIPPTSKGRFGGYVQGNLFTKGLKPSQYLTRCSKGEKVQKAAKPFYPWKFEMVAD